MFAVFASVKDESYNTGVFIIHPVGEGRGGRGLGQIMRDGEEETFEVFPCGEGVGGVVTVST